MQSYAHLTREERYHIKVMRKAESATAHCAHRIVLGTLDSRIIALNGRTGTVCGDFGTKGEIDLTVGLSEHESGEYAITSAPAILNDLIITDAYVEDSVRKGVPSGVVRGYDARTGEFGDRKNNHPKRAWRQIRLNVEGYDSQSARLSLAPGSPGSTPPRSE